jgi:hypothetical protein
MFIWNSLRSYMSGWELGMVVGNLVSVFGCSVCHVALSKTVCIWRAVCGNNIRWKCIDMATCGESPHFLCCTVNFFVSLLMTYCTSLKKEQEENFLSICGLLTAFVTCKCSSCLLLHDALQLNTCVHLVACSEVGEWLSMSARSLMWEIESAKPTVAQILLKVLDLMSL